MKKKEKRIACQINYIYTVSKNLFTPRWRWLQSAVAKTGVRGREQLTTAHVERELLSIRSEENAIHKMAFEHYRRAYEVYRLQVREDLVAKYDSDFIEKMHGPHALVEDPPPNPGLAADNEVNFKMKSRYHRLFSRGFRAFFEISYLHYDFEVTVGISMTLSAYSEWLDNQRVIDASLQFWTYCKPTEQMIGATFFPIMMDILAFIDAAPYFAHTFTIAEPAGKDRKNTCTSLFWSTHPAQRAAAFISHMKENFPGFGEFASIAEYDPESGGIRAFPETKIELLGMKPRPVFGNVILTSSFHEPKAQREVGFVIDPPPQAWEYLHFYVHPGV